MAEQINSAIQQVNTVRRHLSQNASEVKLQIHSGISRHLEVLRNREVWLLNQVDVIVNLKDDVLQKQQARLNQQLGVIQSHSNHGDDSNQILPEGLKPEETPHIIFKSDSAALRESIVSYGRIDAHGFMDPLTAFIEHENPSTSLPRPFEDYDDGDHMMCYKPVQPIGTATSINVKLPKISVRPEDWLARSTGTMTTSSSTTPKFSFPTLSTKTSDWLATDSTVRTNELRPLVRSETSSSIQNWLQQIKHNPVGEDEEDYEIVGSSGTDSDLSDIVDIAKEVGSGYVKMNRDMSSSTISGWLLHADSCPDPDTPNTRADPWSQYFINIREDMDRWLLCDQTPMKKAKISDNDVAMETMVNEDQVDAPVINMSQYLCHIGQEQGKWLQNTGSKCAASKLTCAASKSGQHASQVGLQSSKGQQATKYQSHSRWPSESNSNVTRPTDYNICDGFKRYFTGDLLPWMSSCPEVIRSSNYNICDGFKRYFAEDLSLWMSSDMMRSVNPTTRFDCQLFKPFQSLGLVTDEWLYESKVMKDASIPDFTALCKSDSSRVWLKNDHKNQKLFRNTSFGSFGSHDDGLYLAQDRECQSEKSYSTRSEVDLSKWLSKDSLQNL